MYAPSPCNQDCYKECPSNDFLSYYYSITISLTLEVAHLVCCYFRLNHSYKMSGGLEVLALKEEDVTKLLASSCHQGSTNEDYQMKQYIYRRKPDGECSDH